MAYLVGALADGYLYHNPDHHIYRVSYYQKLKKYHTKCIEPRIVMLFGKRGHFYYASRKGVYFYEITSKTIYQQMYKAADSFKGHNNRSIPNWILNGDKSEQQAFIQGFFDADGYYAINEAASD